MEKKKTGLSKSVHDHILEQIMTKQLLPGERIPEEKIATEFKISRTPVRDAMRQLANEGLIELIPNRFAKVKEFNSESIAEIGTLRIALDTMAIKLASLYGSRIDFIHLADIAKQCEAAYLANNTVLKRQLDIKFHMTLAKISGNSLLLKFQKELYLRIQYILLTHPNPISNEERHLQQHFEITEALQNNDETLAVEIITDHLTSFYQLEDKFPQSFFTNA
ncbi:MAG: GntR family transcriptional regulator [Lachnospiraceae bacterium]|nr:GntR family transcriptional regulator [Lachnospiraceae bacterium]